VVAIVVVIWRFIAEVETNDPEPLSVFTKILLLAVLVFCFKGLYMVEPNSARVARLFGEYAGTDKAMGLRWANPFYSLTSISLRMRNFECSTIKVNDKDGNPIEIAAVVVWQVVDAAEAIFEVDDYTSYVKIQSESALRNMATSYPYDDMEEGTIALRSHTEEVTLRLLDELKGRLDKAGVDVKEARITHLAYAPEIASAMLQRQQAGAIISARRQIVEGAVGMVNMALEKLSNEKILELDEERKAAMVSNLLVVLCGDKNAQPVLNTGSLYT
jgi:regulator of protease activity HflC (stomatin/prohibitin superfamily)